MKHTQTLKQARPTSLEFGKAFAGTGAKRTRVREHPQASSPPRQVWVGPARLGPRSENENENETKTENRRACWKLKISGMALEVMTMVRPH